MVLREEQFRFPVSVSLERLQLLQQRVSLEELVFHPDRQRLAEGREPARREGEVGLEQPLELQKRLIVEGDVVELRGREPGDLQAGLDGVVRKVGVVLLAREALLLRRRHHLAVDDQRRSAVMVVSRDAEDLHPVNIARAGRSAVEPGWFHTDYAAG